VSPLQTATSRSGPGRILVVGGSIAGLFAAIALRRRGFDVQVYERAGEALANRGAGIATHQALYDAVRAAGMELRDEMGVHSDGRIVLDATGTVIAKLDTRQVMTSWGLIYRFLREQIPAVVLHDDHALVGIETDRDGVRARFANGREASGDWLVGADGTRSTVRQLVAPEISSRYCGYFAWRGLFEETRIAPAVREALAHHLALNMAPGGHWLGYFVAGAGDEIRPGERRYNWAWYRTAARETYEDHLTDATGVFHENGIPHGLVRRRFVDLLQEQAHAQLAPQLRAIVAATPQPFLQGIYDLGCERLIYGRVVVIGDAAFTARPHVGLGVSKAAEDAVTLADALAGERALVAWERDRLAYGRAVLDWSRDLGSYCGPAPRDATTRAKAHRHQQPEVLMTETAAVDPARFLARYGWPGPEEGGRTRC